MNIKKTRERCGDCYYNGNCFLNLSECYFIKKENKKRHL